MNLPSTAVAVAAAPSPLALLVENGRMAVANVVQQAVMVQEVMKAVMKPGVHYGVLPGTDKPTLYKAGAEKLCLVFHIADSYVTEDLSDGDRVRYRVKCIGRHQQSDIVMGEGMGECSSGEEKYRWRKAIAPQEWEETPEGMRRLRWKRGKGGSFYSEEQVRTEPADLANTILKMANKRAKMAMVLNVLAASDAFSQDLEDLDDTLRDHLVAADDGAPQTAAAPQAPAAPPPPAEVVMQADAFEKWLTTRAQKAIDGGAPHGVVIEHARGKGVTLTEEQLKAILALKPAAQQASAPAASAPAPAAAAAPAEGSWGDSTMDPPRAREPGEEG